MTGGWLVLVESNTTGTGRLFCAAARRLGMRPVLFARDPARYPYVAADGIAHRVVDTADDGALWAACADLDGPVVGVTSSSEYFMATAAALAARRALPHPDPVAVRECRDKERQRRLLAAAGQPGPAFGPATTPDAAVAAALGIGLPVVVKPVAGSGSIGIRLCRSAAEVRAAAAAVLDVDPASLALPPQRAVLVEEYLDGPEFSVETLDDRVVGVTAKHLGGLPHFVEIGHDFPAALPAGERDAIGVAALAALRALGLGWGAAHVEVRLTAPGPRVVEVNPRLAGGMIPRLVAHATGIDLIEALVAKVAGLDRPIGPTRSGAAAIRFLVAAEAGRLAGVDGVAAARTVPGVVEVGVTAVTGRPVVLRHSFQDRLAYVIASATDGSVAAHAAEDALRRLAARIVPADDLAMEERVR